MNRERDMSGDEYELDAQCFKGTWEVWSAERAGGQDYWKRRGGPYMRDVEEGEGKMQIHVL